MTKSTLNPSQRRTVEIIEMLGFGRIDGLSIRNGQPCYDPPPQIHQEIKLGSEPEGRPNPSSGEFKLRREFENLFEQLGRLPDGRVDIEIRHSMPFRLVLERRYAELAS